MCEWCDGWLCNTPRPRQQLNGTNPLHSTPTQHSKVVQIASRAPFLGLRIYFQGKFQMLKGAQDERLDAGGSAYIRAHATRCSKRTRQVRQNSTRYLLTYVDPVIIPSHTSVLRPRAHAHSHTPEHNFPPSFPFHSSTLLFHHSFRHPIHFLSTLHPPLSTLHSPLPAHRTYPRTSSGHKKMHARPPATHPPTHGVPPIPPLHSLLPPTRRGTTRLARYAPLP